MADLLVMEYLREIAFVDDLPAGVTGVKVFSFIDGITVDTAANKASKILGHDATLARPIVSGYFLASSRPRA